MIKGEVLKIGTIKKITVHNQKETAETLWKPNEKIWSGEFNTYKAREANKTKQPIWWVWVNGWQKK